MSISRSHSENARLIASLKDLLEDNEDTSRTSRVSGEIYLPGDKCPSGMIPCDESSDVCPSEEYRVEPGIYNKKGHRCYTKQGVRRARTLSKDDKNVAVKGLRALVIEVAKLRDMNTEIDKILATSSFESRRQASAFIDEPSKARTQASVTERRLDICEKYNQVIDNTATVKTDEDKEKFIASVLERAGMNNDENLKIAALRLQRVWRRGERVVKCNPEDIVLTGGEDSMSDDSMSNYSMSDADSDFSVY
jgi:hypothetical protein